MLSGFSLPVLEYCSAVWCSAADTHRKLLDRAVSGARFLTAGVFECDIAHRRSVTVLCMLCKIRCNPMHPLWTVCASVGYTRCHGRTSVHLCTALLQNLAVQMDFYSPLSGTILLTPYSMVWDWRVSRAGPMLFYWPKLLYPYTIVFYHFSLSLLSVNRLVLWGWGLRTDRVYITRSQPCIADLF